MGEETPQPGGGDHRVLASGHESVFDQKVEPAPERCGASVELDEMSAFIAREQNLNPNRPAGRADRRHQDPAGQLTYGRWAAARARWARRRRHLIA